MINITEIRTEEELQKAFDIREEVFVVEQGVPTEEEYDEFEKSARHYLAYADSIPCGAARWRQTINGIKLERFAVLKDYRNSQVGSALLQKILADVRSFDSNALVYLHAQLPAMRLYERQGFEKTGNMFLECDIEHYKMVLKA